MAERSFAAEHSSEPTSSEYRLRYAVQVRPKDRAPVGARAGWPTQAVHGFAGGPSARQGAAADVCEAFAQFLGTREQHRGDFAFPPNHWADLPNPDIVTGLDQFCAGDSPLPASKARRSSHPLGHARQCKPRRPEVLSTRPCVPARQQMGTADLTEDREIQVRAESCRHPDEQVQAETGVASQVVRAPDAGAGSRRSMSSQLRSCDSVMEA
jgi:hypothetical protein